MSNLAIRVEGLGKEYRIGGRQESYKTLREELTSTFTAPFRRLRQLTRGTNNGGITNDRFWALKDTSFEIKPGEVVGLIGNNGAGKSTLLKILSRITEPSTGLAEIRGRVGSLLEVGTGFHPELTGRENIYLNGSILGMAKEEIEKKFDEIVEFAEVEKFLETPVKHYSSGMYLRLAFAVAAHLEPEILLVDEVLAVGDARFQKKCLNKMQEVGQHGRTVIFVSHNMPAITRLCSRAIMLRDGQILRDGPAHKVVSEYLSSGLGITCRREWHDLSRAPGNDVVRMVGMRVKSADGSVSESMDIRKPVAVEMDFEVLKSGTVLLPTFLFSNDDGVVLFVSADRDPEWKRRPRTKGQFCSTAWIPQNFLAEGTVIVSGYILTEDPYILHAEEKHALIFQVVDTLEGDSVRGDYAGHMPGVVRPLLKWSTQFTPR